jgi:hypothetical protein
MNRIGRLIPNTNLYILSILIVFLCPCSSIPEPVQI